MPPTLTEAHPPLPLEEIAELARNFHQMEISQQKAVIERVVASHPTLSFDWGGPKWRYRRARRLTGSELPKTVDELIWRKGIPAALGRANPAGFQVLYLADRVETALQEVEADGHPTVIAEFIIQAGRSVRIASIGEMALVQRTGRGYLTNEVSDVLNGMLNACAYDEAKSLLIADQFLYHCLVGHDDYNISSHVALSIFNKNPAVSAIAYPSRRQMGAMNFAVRVENFWQDWALVMVRHAHVRHLAMGYYKLEHVQRVNGIFTSGRLRWTDAPDGERVCTLLSPYTPVET